MNDYEASQKDLYDIHSYAATGTGKSMLANRISWFYDLRGPSFVVDTACSSSMYAFHLACQRLLLRESDIALVGGSNAVIAPSVLRTLSAMRFLSPTGKCHSYDQSADGYARGEGVGMLLLKRLSDAIKDGDPIRSVIRSTALNSYIHPLHNQRSQLRPQPVQEQRCGRNSSPPAWVWFWPRFIRMI